MKPASSRLTRNSSWIAGSSSTTRIAGNISRLPSSFGDFGADLLRRRVPDVLALDDMNDVLGLK